MPTPNGWKLNWIHGIFIKINCHFALIVMISFPSWRPHRCSYLNALFLSRACAVRFGHFVAIRLALFLAATCKRTTHFISVFVVACCVRAKQTTNPLMCIWVCNNLRSQWLRPKCGTAHKMEKEKWNYLWLEDIAIIWTTFMLISGLWRNSNAYCFCSLLLSKPNW